MVGDADDERALIIWLNHVRGEKCAVHEIGSRRDG